MEHRMDNIKDCRTRALDILQVFIKQGNVVSFKRTCQLGSNQDLEVIISLKVFILIMTSQGGSK
jgi:hypothetical protein